MVDITDIPDFPGLPGQSPTPGAPPTVTPVAVVLVTTKADKAYRNRAFNSAAMDSFIADEITAGRAFEANVERWSPWSALQLEMDFAAAVKFNYGRFTIGERSWYGFLDAEYLNLEGATLFAVTEDSWCTYNPTIGYSTVVRSHVAVAASQNDAYGADFLTAPEPIEAPPVRGVLAADLLGAAPDAWTVMVISANDLRGSDVGNPYFALHIENAKIQTAANLATAATIDSSGAPQATIETATYPWMDGLPPTPPIGTPTNGFVPDDDLTVLATSTARAELNTAAAWANVVANFPSAIITPPISGAPEDPAGYWSRALDIAIHADPALYGITDPDLAPIGASKHGLGIRINVQHVTAAQMAAFGFSKFNDYTYTYAGPYVWDEPTPSTIEVWVPFVQSSPMSTIDGVPAGGGCYLFTMRGFAEYMTIMQGAPWITAGMEVRLIPSWAVSGGGDHAFTPAPANDNDPIAAAWAEAASIPVFRGEVISATASPSVLANWRASALTAVGVSSVWKKLLTSQFTDLIVGNGESLASFRPDQWQTADIEFVAVTGAAHGDPSIRIIPNGYNELGNQKGVSTPFGGRPGVPHSGFGQAASNPGNQDVGPYLTANSTYQNWNTMFQNKQLAQTLGLENISLNLGVQGITSALGIASGAAQGALHGGAVGAAGGALAGAGGLLTSSLQAANSITLLAIDKDGSFDIGAYGLQVSGQAAVDTFDTWWQSLFSASGGGVPDVLASAWRAILAQAFEVIIAMPTTDRIASLITMWERYGYMVDRAMIPPRLDPMTHYSYWETENVTILGAMPQESREAVAASFDQGTTLWVSVAEIGTHPDNEPRTGVSY